MDHESKRSLKELHRMWSSASERTDAPARFEREEALWEYWKRSAEGEKEVDESDLMSALSSGIRGVGNVVGELARHDRLPRKSYAMVEQHLRDLAADEAKWGLAQLRARSSLNMIISGQQGDRRSLLDDVLAKGVSWATCLVIPDLSLEEVDYVETEVLRRKTFSGAQREEVRRLCARRRKGP
jgi:hypothetical protein